MVSSPPDAVLSGTCDHLCHTYDGPNELLRLAPEYLAAGLALGQQGVVIASRAEMPLARTVATAAGGTDDVEIVDVAEIYGGGRLDVPATLAAFEQVLDDATGRGKSGLRVVAMLTEVVADPVARRDFAGWEHVAGEWQSVRDIASVCSFDRRALGENAVHELACLHPRVVTTGAAVPFRLYFRAGQLTLEGEIDSFAAPLLARAISHVAVSPRERLVIDARGLAFVNHRGLATLAEGLAARSEGVTLVGGPAVLTRLKTALGIPDQVLDVLPCPW